MKRTTLMTILAMSLALGASRADMPTGANKPEEHHNLAKWIQVGAEGVTAGNDTDQQQPVRLNLPGKADPGETAGVDCKWILYELHQEPRLFHVGAGPVGPVPAPLDLRMSCNCLPPRYTRRPGEESPGSSCFADGLPTRRHIL